MADTVCLNKTYIVMLLFALIIIGIYQYQKIRDINNMSCPLLPCPKQEIKECPVQKCPTQSCPKCPHTENNTVIIKDTIGANIIPPIDPVKEYDYRKAYDPLEDPTRRADGYFFPPPYTNIPTRGYPDGYRQFGVLTTKDETATNNTILRLFGRQKYLGSNNYDYYTAINVGNDQIKIPIDRKKEIYDGDTLTIKEVGGAGGVEYTATIYKYDSPQYHPYLF